MGRELMAKDRKAAMDALAKDLTRQIRTEANARFLKRMPMFSLEHSTPQDMLALLDDLDRAEHGQRREARR
jgi:hypothetical protein